MILSRRVALGGAYLDEVHESIVIKSVVPGAAQKKTQSVSRMHGAGNRITSETWDPLKTQVTFGIDLPKTELALRREIYDAVTAWALRRGWLTTNEMPNRQMYVDRITMPAGSDMRDWTKDYTIELTAYNVPFWQGNVMAAVSGSNSASGSTRISLDGNENSVLNFTFENTSGKQINDLTVITNSGKLVLNDMSLAGNASVIVDHGNDGILRVQKKTGASVMSIMSCVHYSSSDDLYIRPGDSTVTFSATRAGRLSINCRGRYR